MAIRRYLANADNTITNAFEFNLTTRGTGSNMGASDVSEVFTIYGQASSSSLEIARIIKKKSPSVWKSSLLTSNKEESLKIIKNEKLFISHIYTSKS